jgi:hypothetical protein
MHILYNSSGKRYSSGLSGIVVTVLATGLKGHEFKLGRGSRFLRAIKICSTPSFRWEVKPEVPCCKILRHAKDPLTYQITECANSHSSINSSELFHLSLLVGLPESSDRQVRSYPQLASPPWLPHLHSPGE